jgi:hypothetical protein
MGYKTMPLSMNLSLNERTLALTPTLSLRLRRTPARQAGERETCCSSAQVHGFKARRSALRGILSPTLSPLVPRGEREKHRMRLIMAQTRM